MNGRLSIDTCACLGQNPTVGLEKGAKMGIVTDKVKALRALFVLSCLS